MKRGKLKELTTIFCQVMGLFLFHFFCCSIVCFNKTMEKIRRAQKRGIFYLLDCRRCIFFYFNFHLNPGPLCFCLCLDVCWKNETKIFCFSPLLVPQMLQLFRITRLWIGFFCDVNQNLKPRRFLSGPLRNRKILQLIQKVMVCDLWLVDFDAFCVSVFQGSLLLNFRVRVFSRFSSQVFLPSYWNMASLDSQGEIDPIELPNSEKTQIWEGKNELVRSRQHLIKHLYLTSKDWMLW